MNTEPTGTAPELIPKVPDQIKERTRAPFHFTPKELGDLGKRLSTTRRDAVRIEAELASIKAEFKSKLETLELEQDTICRLLDDGFEMRETAAVVTFNDPGHGRKSYRHEETGEFIREEAMSPGDWQHPLFKTADGVDATAPEHPERQEDVGASEEDIAEAAEGVPAGTPLGDALDQAASLSEAPLLKMDLAKYNDESAIVANFKSAAKKAGWSEVQVSMLKKQLQATDSVSRMKEVLQPHCQSAE